MYTVKEISNKINKSESTIRDYISRNEDKFKGHIIKRTVLLIDNVGLDLLNEYYSKSVQTELDDNSLQKQLEEKEIEIEELKVKIKARDVQNITLEGTVFGMKKCAETIIKENNELKEMVKQLENIIKAQKETYDQFIDALELKHNALYADLYLEKEELAKLINLIL